MPKLGGRRRAGGTEAASFLGCPATAEVPLLNLLCTAVGNGDVGTCMRLQFSMCCGGRSVFDVLRRPATWCTGCYRLLGSWASEARPIGGPSGVQTPGTWRQASTIRRLLMLDSLRCCVLPTTGSRDIAGHSGCHGQVRSHGPGTAKLASRPGAIAHPCVSWPLNIEESFCHFTS